jgi:predicted nucleotidyltransferase
VSSAFQQVAEAGVDTNRHSDVDLVVIGEVPPSDVLELLRPVAEALGREITPFVLTPAEFREKRRLKNHFVDRVLSGPKIDLIGDARRVATAG